MPPAPDNTDGFWEPNDVVILHSRMFWSLQSDWDDYREIPLVWFESAAAEEFKIQLDSWLEREIKEKQLLLIKDPRVCRFMPLWLDICDRLAIALNTVIAFRNPIEVSRSLQARNQFPPVKSALLWLRHFIDAERFTRGRSRCFVDFDDLMKNPLTTIRRIEKELGLTFPVPDSELGPLLDDALKPSLRHHVATPADLARTGTPSSPPMIVYPWALAAAAGENPSPGTLDEIAEKLREVEQGRSIRFTPSP